ncbi:MAG: 30S ribosomal protein S1 [Candidatus Neomarinimicrobiota bacterium]|nr:30S ribosomal protein S1 [Candidatus Neomarinimicrobiota bacterium]
MNEKLDQNLEDVKTEELIANVDSDVVEVKEVDSDVVEVKKTTTKKIKDYLSKDLFSGIKIISGKESDEEVNSLGKSDLSEYENTFKDISENQIISAKVIGISENDIMVDIGFKSEGLINRSEFNNKDLPEIGSKIDIFLEKFEDTDGNITLSKYKADFIKRWDQLREFCDNAKPVKGKIIKRVKGGLVVDLDVIQAFLPGSQVDVQPVKNFDDFLNKEFDFQIVKVDELRKNLVVSRKAILQESLNEKRQEIMDKIKVDETISGIVKNITDFGAFIDLGGVDGLIHITDFSWGRINHPSEVVSIGDTVDVKVIDYNKETSRISLGIKQLVANPWKLISDKYNVGDVISGKIVSIMNYGIFVEIEKGVEGLVHISEISWNKNVENLSDHYKTGDILESKILSIDIEDQKISLGIKQLTEDPWKNVSSRFAINDKIKGSINNTTKFGAYVNLGDNIEGFIRNTDFHWTKNISHSKEFVKKEDNVELIVLEISDKDRKIFLGMKQMTENPWSEIKKQYLSGQAIQGTFNSLTDSGMVIGLENDIEGFVPIDKISKKLRKNYLSSIKQGELVDLLVVEVEEKDKRVILMFNQPDEDQPDED